MECSMFNADKPIKNVSEDLLGRASFAKQLGKAIMQFNSKENIVIGMYGKWGTGKTSIINMALQEISDVSSELEDSDKPIIIKFEPWNFVNNENLITQFFYLLREKLNKKENIAFKNSIGEALVQYSEALEFASVIPQIGMLPSVLKLSMVFVGKQLKKKYANRSIDSAKDSLMKLLEKQKKKILVIIDDIDRLSNEQIRMIFQLVKQVACFPNTIYVLSMDKEVVCRALEEIQQCSGEEYLEKIVQIPFNIPELNKEKVQEFLFRKLDGILESKSKPVFRNEHWRKVFQCCIAPYINTIRDVNRIVNSFQFKYDMIYTEVDFSDLLAITTLEVLRPKIVAWIIENKEMLCGGTYDYQGVVWEEQDKRKKEYLEIFTKGEIGNKKELESIAALFPKFDKAINHYYELITESDLRGQLRIAHRDRFDLYFKLDISEVKIHRNMIDTSIYKLKEQELDDLVKSVNISGNIIIYLDELRGRLDEVPYDRIEIILRVLYRNKASLIGSKGESILQISADSYAENCIQPLIERLSSSAERYEIYNQIIKNGDVSVLSGICRDINRIELAYGRLAGKEVNENGQLITLEELEQLEKTFATRLKELADRDRIFEVESLYFIKYFWEAFDDEECKKYFSEKLKDDKYKLKFICGLAAEWRSDSGKGWTFTKSLYEEYVNEDDIYTIIKNYDKKKMLLDFTELEIIKLAFFVLNRGMGEMEHASEKEAANLVQEWMNQ